MGDEFDERVEAAAEDRCGESERGQQCAVEVEDGHGQGTGAVGSGLMMFPYLGAVSAGNWPLIFVFGAIMSGCAYSLANSIWPSFYAEMFPTTARVTGLALGTQVGFAVSGGLAPVLASAVAGAGGENWVSGAAFTAGVCIVVGLVAMTAKETKGLSLEEIDVVHEERSR